MWRRHNVLAFRAPTLRGREKRTGRFRAHTIVQRVPATIVLGLILVAPGGLECRVFETWWWKEGLRPEPALVMFQPGEW